MFTNLHISEGACKIPFLTICQRAANEPAWYILVFLALIHLFKGAIYMYYNSFEKKTLKMTLRSAETVTYSLIFPRREDRHTIYRYFEC